MQVCVVASAAWTATTLLTALFSPALYTTFNIFNTLLGFLLRALSVTPLCTWMGDSRGIILFAEVIILLANLCTSFTHCQNTLTEAVLVFSFTSFLQLYACYEHITAILLTKSTALAVTRTFCSHVVDRAGPMDREYMVVVRAEGRDRL